MNYLSLHEVEGKDPSCVTALEIAADANFEGLDRFANLTAIKITEGLLTEAQWKVLTGISSLLSINLYEAPIDHTAIVAVSKITSLERIDLRGAQFAAKDLQMLSSLKRLRHLAVSIDDQTLKDADVEFIAELKDLEHLDLSQNSLLHCLFLLAIPDPTKIVSLNLSETGFDTDVWEIVCSYVNLQELFLDGLNLEHVDFAALGNSKNLRRLTMIRSKIPATFKSGLVNWQMLQRLELAFCQLPNDCWEEIGAKKAMEYLNLGGTNLDDDGVRLWKGFPELKTLILWSTAITDDALEIISGFEKLNDLVLNRTKITNKGIATLQRLAHLERLTLYDMGHLDSAPIESLRNRGVKVLT